MERFRARSLLALTAFVAGLALAGGPTRGANVNVAAGGGTNTFNPKTVTVSEGDSVTWNNAGGFHNVKFEDGLFEQPAAPDSSAWTVSRTFTAGGTYRYYCEAHGAAGGVGMSGTVIVNPPVPFAAPFTLSAAGRAASEPQVAVDPNGNAVFAWTRSDGTNTRIEARARSAGGTLSAVQLLSASGQNATAPQVGVDSSGNAVFAWTRPDGTNDRVQVRTRSAGGTLGTVQTLSAAGQDAIAPQIGVEGDGDAIVAWGRFDGTTQCGGVPGCLRIQARTRSAAGTLGTAQTLSAAGRAASEPQVAVDPNGNAVFAWTRSDGTNTRIEARARSAGGTLSAVQLLSASGQNATAPQVGVGTNGAAAVWGRFDGTTQCGGLPGCSRIQAAAGP